MGTKYAYHQTASAVPLQFVPAVIEQASDQGWEFVTTLFYGHMQAPAQILNPKAETAAVAMHSVVFRKKYDGNKRPDNFEFQVGIGEPGQE